MLATYTAFSIGALRSRTSSTGTKIAERVMGGGMDASDRLRQYQFETGASVRDIATLTGLSESTIRALLSGRRNPSPATLEILSQNLGLELEDDKLARIQTRTKPRPATPSPADGGSTYNRFLGVQPRGWGLLGYAIARLIVHFDTSLWTMPLGSWNRQELYTWVQSASTILEDLSPAVRKTTIIASLPELLLLPGLLPPKERLAASKHFLAEGETHYRKWEALSPKDTADPEYRRKLLFLRAQFHIQTDYVEAFRPEFLYLTWMTAMPDDTVEDLYRLIKTVEFDAFDNVSLRPTARARLLAMGWGV